MRHLRGVSLEARVIAWSTAARLMERDRLTRYSLGAPTPHLTSPLEGGRDELGRREREGWDELRRLPSEGER